MPASWSFIMTDNAFEPLGEVINAYDRTVSIPLNKLDTASLRVRLDNALSADMMTAARYLKAYRDDTLVFFGPIVTAEETGGTEGASVKINCVGAGWILQKRLVGKSALGTQFVATDRATIMGTLINTLNAESNTGIGIAAGNTAASASTYTAGPYKFAYDTLTELSAGLAGFDWRILPVDNWDSANARVSGSTIGALYARPVIGEAAPEAVFEWGGGRSNVSDYSRTVSRDGQADKVYHIASPGPDVPGYPVVSSQNATAISTFGLIEDIAQGDLLDQTMRQALTDAHVNVRAFPRHIINFTPHIDPGRIGRLPNYLQHYNVGDTGTIRIAYAGEPRVSASVRVWGVNFDIQNDGTERATAVLAEEA